MASDTSMDCELCERGLVDLSYGELDEGTAAQVRAHLEGCASCRQAWERIEAGRGIARRLVLEDAPSLTKVLEAAREQAALNRAAREANTAPLAQPAVSPVEAPAPKGSWLEWLSALVMGPQLGVVTVLLLVVGIGLWYLPQLRDGGSPGSAALLEPDPQHGAEASALAPAEPLQLSHDPRTGRVTVDRPQGREVESAPPRPVAPRPEVRAASPQDSFQARDELAELAAIDGELAADSAAMRDELVPTTTPGAVAALEEPAPPAVTAPAAARDDQEAVMDSDDLAAAALHGQARQLAQANRHLDAVARYQQLLTRHPQYLDGARASLEMAESLRRLGRVREARVALERASRSPVASIAGAARRQLLELDVREQASSDDLPTAEE